MKKLKNGFAGIAVIIVTAIMLSFGCKQTQDGKHSVAAEKFTITFGAEGGSGGSVNASVDGIGINSGAEVEKGKTIIFTAIPDSGFEAEVWTNAAESPSDKKTATLTVTAAMDVRVRFKKSSEKKEVKVKSFTVHTVPVDMERVVWSVLIPNSAEKVENNDIDLIFDGTADDVLTLTQVLSVTLIENIATGEVKELSVSVPETEKYCAWSKTLKVRRAYKPNQEKGDLKFSKLLICGTDYTAQANQQLSDPNALLQMASANISLKSLVGDKTFRLSDVEVEYSFSDGSMIIPSAKISLKYIENGGLIRTVTETEVFNLAEIVKAGEDAIFVLQALPNGIGGWAPLSFRFTFFIPNDKAEVLYVTVPKSSDIFNKDAGINANIELKTDDGKLEIIESSEHDGSADKPVLIKGKLAVEIDLSKITDLKINISYMAVLNYGKDKNNLLPSSGRMVKFTNEPIFLQLISEDGSVTKHYLLTLENEIPVATVIPENFVSVPVQEEAFAGINPAYQLYQFNGDKWKGVFIGGRNIKLSPYAISKFELTYELWYEVRQWAETNGYVFANKGKEGSIGSAGAHPSSNKNHPVMQIGWRDAVVWCNAYTQKVTGSDAECVYRKDFANGAVLKNSSKEDCDSAFADMEKKGFRLPTEAEWEYAARYQNNDGKNAEKYGSAYLTNLNSLSGAEKPAGFEGLTKPSGETWETLRDEAAKYAVYGEWWDGEEESTAPQNPDVTKTARVGSKTENKLGLFDMSGNVWEWCFDIYNDNAAINDSAYLKDGNVVDPQGAIAGTTRAFRGGSYADEAGYCAVGRRSGNAPDVISVYAIGMRLACSLK